MKKLLPALLLLAVAVPLLVAASAAAKAVNATIEKDGFSPARVTLQAGDTITWRNKESAKHRVVCSKCPFKSNVLNRGGSYSYVFLKAGTFAITDPLHGKTQTVVVKPASATVDVQVAPAVITYGLTATITGKTSSPKAGQSVEIFAFPCLTSAQKLVATVKTKRGGVYTFKVHPPKMTTYHSRYSAKSGPVTSSIVNVTVKPVVKLTRVKPGQFTVSVAAGNSFVGKTVAIERFIGPKRKKWITTRTVTLETKKSAAKPAGTTVSSVDFKSQLPAGVRIRAVLRPLQAIPCYVTSTSRTINT
jgi:plastocyanin